MTIRKVKNFIKRIGPGLITGAADDDPSGISTYSQTGAQFGLAQLWLSLYAIPFMVCIQEMCGRLGLVTGKGLAQLIKENFSKKILYVSVVLLCLANVLNVGADIGAMGASMEMVTGCHALIWIFVFTAAIIGLQISMPYKSYARVLKYLGLFLVGYIITAVASKPDISDILYYLFVPTIIFSGAFALNITAVLGTTISPYLFFWQASEEVEENVATKRIMDVGSGQRPKRVGNVTIRNMGLDTVIGMIVSNFIMASIIISSNVLHTEGIVDIATAPQAAEALRPFVGDNAYLLFAAGIIGVSFLAIPVLCGSAAYALCETFGWKYGMNKGIGHAKQFYGVMVVSMLLGMGMNLFHFDAIKALYYSAAFNGMVAPFMIALIILLAGNRTIMGKHTNKKWQSVFGWIIMCVMAIAGIATIASGVM